MGFAGTALKLVDGLRLLPLAAAWSVREDSDSTPVHADAAGAAIAAETKGCSRLAR